MLKSKLLKGRSLPTAVYFKSSCEASTWCAVMRYQSAVAFLIYYCTLSEWYFDVAYLVKWVSSIAFPRNQLLKCMHVVSWSLFNKYCKIKTNLGRLTSACSKHFASCINISTVCWLFSMDQMNPWPCYMYSESRSNTELLVSKQGQTAEFSHIFTACRVFLVVFMCVCVCSGFGFVL